MGIFDWAKKGVDVDGQENAIDETPQLQDDAYRRKEAFKKLINGDDNRQTMSQETKRTVRVFLVKTNQDLSEVVSIIKSGEPAIVDLSKVSKSEVQRTQDFLSGVVFALEAHISSFQNDANVQNNMFLITPKGVIIR